MFNEPGFNEQLTHQPFLTLEVRNTLVMHKSAKEKATNGSFSVYSLKEKSFHTHFGQGSGALYLPSPPHGTTTVLAPVALSSTRPPRQM